jgi:hypothetical protein
MPLSAMKQIFLTFYHALSSHEKKTFWFGSIVFTIGSILLLNVLRPPSWWGWQETKGELVSTQRMDFGQFSGGSTVLGVQYFAEDGSMRKGEFSISPIILSTMKTIRVFYQKNDPSVFYVHNPTLLIIALTMVIFGSGVLLTFYLYYRDRLNGVDYD